MKRVASIIGGERRGLERIVGEREFGVQRQMGHAAKCGGTDEPEA